ncbi:MAG: rhamnogalacturonan lyase family protein, partial [Planctomycetota bacterium]
MKIRPRNLMYLLLVLPVLGILSCASIQHRARRSQYDSNPFVIRLEIPAPEDDKGSIIVADLNRDGLKDYLVTVPGHIAAYENNGRRLWVLKTDIRLSMDSEKWGLPGQHAPGVQAADVDQDGQIEVLFLTEDSTVCALNGATASVEWTAKPAVPQGAAQWEHLVVACFRGEGDTDLLLQATNEDGYRMGRYLSAHRTSDLRKGNLKPVWEMDDFLACAHTAARVADLDLDGKDEVIGGTLVSSEGQRLYQFPLTGHIDAVAVADVRPDIPGLEVVALEEGNRRSKERDRVFLANASGLIWQANHENREPQDAAIGDLDPARPGLEIFCRHRGTGLAARPIPKEKFPANGYQRPFVLDAYGNVISDYSTEDVTPEGWTPMGLQVCQTIHFDGAAKALVVATEREQNGNVALIDPIGGEFLLHLKNEKADRLFVVDVSGDWREEIVILNGNELHIYHHEGPNADPGHARLWDEPHYRRNKMTW